MEIDIAAPARIAPNQRADVGRRVSQSAYEKQGAELQEARAGRRRPGPDPNSQQEQK